MDPSNPYAPPTSVELSSDPGGLRFQNASQGKRFLNYLIDTYLPPLAIGFAIGATSPAVTDWLDSLNTWESLGLGYIYSFVYYLAMEGTAKTTIGKLITGSKVVSEDGSSATFGQILGRTFARFIPFEPFSFFNRTNRGWHDTLSHTRVVDLRAAPLPGRYTGTPTALPSQKPRPLQAPTRSTAPPPRQDTPPPLPRTDTD